MNLGQPALPLPSALCHCPHRPCHPVYRRHPTSNPLRTVYPAPRRCATAVAAHHGFAGVDFAAGTSAPHRSFAQLNTAFALEQPDHLR